MPRLLFLQDEINQWLRIHFMLRFLFLLHFRLHLLISDIGQREVFARWHEPYQWFFDVFLRTESRPFLHSLALERRFERTQVAEVHDVACCLGGEIQYCRNFLQIKRGGFRHALAEISEVNTVTSRRLRNLHGLPILCAYIELTLCQNELQRFVSHNVKRRFPLVSLVRTGKH